MDDEADTGREESAAFAREILCERFAELAEDRRDVDAALFDHLAFGEDARPPAAAFFARPLIRAKCGFSIDGGERGGDLVLDPEKECVRRSSAWAHGIV